MRKLILLNGPSGSGKDEIGKIIQKLDPSFSVDKFARILKEDVHYIYFGQRLPHDIFENCKEEPFFRYGNQFISPRQAYIMHSEGYIKPLHGKSYYGTQLANYQRLGINNLVVTDGGFQEEALEIAKVFDQVTLVRLSRPEKTFERDSRSYWKNSLDFYEYKIYNDSTLENLETQVEQLLQVL